MRLITKIIQNISLAIILLAFMVSTTGFTFYTHECNHHETLKSIAVIEECCEADKAEAPADFNSCCESESIIVAESACGLSNEHGNCCETETDYYRLSEWFIQSQTENSMPDFILPEFRMINIDQIEETDEHIGFQLVSSDIKTPKLPIYRLYRQEKIAPPVV